MRLLRLVLLQLPQAPGHGPVRGLPHLSVRHRGEEGDTGVNTDKVVICHLLGSRAEKRKEVL